MAESFRDKLARLARLAEQASKDPREVPEEVEEGLRDPLDELLNALTAGWAPRDFDFRVRFR